MCAIPEMANARSDESVSARSVNVSHICSQCCIAFKILLELADPWSAIKFNRGLGGADILEVQGFCLSLVTEVHIPLPAIRKTFEGEPRRCCFWIYPSRLPRAEINDPRG